MTLIGMVLTTAIQLYVLVLVLRVVLDWISHFARTWRPSGIILVACNLVYSLTDPPLRFFGKLIPPLRLGGIALDMGFLVFFLLLLILQRVVVWIFLSPFL